ncbi:Uncharacterized protein dnm_070550 [Desulfonema magnum]|uniref:Uncharacterized protein n=1 Tax=Desulfonema magnum TaxID=45655 RepID=A0A975BSR1_9BACT|nr:Uncharacterized protein dnm_070550 [Desulfonema magnum]
MCLCVFVADFFGCVKGGTHPFFATKARRHKVSRSLSVVPLCLCGFVADFFGCVKGGTHPFFATKARSLTKSFSGSFVSLWLIFSDV